MARKKVSSKDVAGSKSGAIPFGPLDGPLGGPPKPERVPFIETPEGERMIKTLDASRGFLVSYTAVVPDPKGGPKQMLEHTILHHSFPLGDILPSIKHVKDLCVQTMESEPQTFGKINLNEHVE